MIHNTTMFALYKAGKLPMHYDLTGMLEERRMQVIDAAMRQFEVSAIQWIELDDCLLPRVAATTAATDKRVGMTEACRARSTCVARVRVSTGDLIIVNVPPR